MSGHGRASQGLWCPLPVGDLCWLSLVPPSAFSAQCQPWECQVWGHRAVTWQGLLSAPLPASPICVWAVCPPARLSEAECCVRVPGPVSCRVWVQEAGGAWQGSVGGREAELGWAAMAAQRGAWEACCLPPWLLLRAPPSSSLSL